jgi:hypothetical protein
MIRIGGGVHALATAQRLPGRAIRVSVSGPVQGGIQDAIPGSIDRVRSCIGCTRPSSRPTAGKETRSTQGDERATSQTDTHDIPSPTGDKLTGRR